MLFGKVKIPLNPEVQFFLSISYSCNPCNNVSNWFWLNHLKLNFTILFVELKRKLFLNWLMKWWKCLRNISVELTFLHGHLQVGVICTNFYISLKIPHYKLNNGLSFPKYHDVICDWSSEDNLFQSQRKISTDFYIIPEVYYLDFKGHW